jgi:ankyrin repeat protein
MEVVLGMLLENQADATGEEDDKTRVAMFGEALIGAAEGGHEELTRRLLDSGADPTTTDSSGSTAIHWAAWGGHTEIENLRYDEDNCPPSPTSSVATPPPPYPDSDFDSAEPTTTPTTTRAFGHESVIVMLQESGVAINAQNSQGCTALHWVAGAGSRGMVKWLVELGADVTLRDGSGRRAVDRARETRDEVVIALLEGR